MDSTHGTQTSELVDRQLMLADADITGIMRRVKARGFDLVRGLPADPQIFELVTNRFALIFRPFRRAVIGRRAPVARVDTSIVTVNEGVNGVGWHAEASFTPLWPDVLFFCCLQPAATGGDTLLVDGTLLYAHMSPAHQRAAVATRLVYSKTVSRSQVQDMAAVLATFKSQSIEEMTATFNRVRIREGDEWRFTIDDTSVHYRYSHPLVRCGRWSELPGICAFLTGNPSTVDGTPIAKHLQQAIAAAADRVSYRHCWLTGDLLVVDNTRMMHARDAFTDRQRNIVLRMGSERA